VSQGAVAAIQDALETAGISFREGGVEMSIHMGLSAPTSPFTESSHMGQNSRRSGGTQNRGQSERPLFSVLSPEKNLRHRCSEGAEAVVQR
jgi:hypothetical protein